MDNQTLTFTIVIVASVTSLALFVNFVNSRQIPGLLAISIGFLITSAGTMLLTTQGSLTPIFSIVIAYALLLGGRIPVLMGLAAFWKQEKSRLPIYCAAWFAGTLIAIYYFTLMDDSMLWRIRVYTVMKVIFSLSSIYLIAMGLKTERGQRPVMAVTPSYGAFLALMLFSFNAVLEIVLMIVRTGTLLSAPEEGRALLLLGSIFSMVMFAFAIIIMTMEELTVEHKENSIYDPITTILNQSSFLEVGQRILGAALRYQKPVSLLTIEVENMDEVTKEHGHKVSNDMLKHFSMMASDRRRNEDVLSRSGPKEFRMLLPGVDEEGAKVVIRKIEDTMKAEEFVYRGNVLEIKVYIASVTRSEEELNLEQMLEDGDVELFRVKESATADVTAK